MIKNILNIHKDMMYNFMEVADMDEYGLAWFCFLKGALFTALLVWMF
tara:strand:- start:610 stop:750 length:141 start_codon:yes stop_codon:yes gene_type:complete